MDLKTICNEAQKYGDVLAILSKKSSTTLQVKSDKIASLKDNETQTLHVRISKGKKFGYSVTPNAENWRETIGNAAKIMRISKPLDEEIPLSPKAPRASMKNVSKKLLNLNDDDLIGQSEELVNSVKSKDSNVRVIMANFSNDFNEAEILNSNGVSAYHVDTEFGMEFSAGMKDIVEDEIHRDNDIFDVAPYGKNVGELIIKSMNPGKAPTKKMPVIMDPLAVSDIFGSVLAGAFNGDDVHNHRSYLWDKLDQEIFSKSLTITDDGLKGLNMRPVDVEGTPSQKTTLVQKGKIKSFLYDLYTAKRDGTKSTGNCASLTILPSIGPSNFRIKPGKQSTEEMISSVKEGIFVRMLMGTHTANSVTGDASLSIPSGFYIKDGELKHAIRKSMINFNIYQALKEIEIGKDVRQETEIVTPQIKFENIQMIA